MAPAPHSMPSNADRTDDNCTALAYTHSFMFYGRRGSGLTALGRGMERSSGDLWLAQNAGIGVSVLVLCRCPRKVAT